MVEMTMEQMRVANEALGRLAQMDLPVSLGLKVRRLARALEPHMEDYQEEYRKLVEKHGARDADGELVAEGDRVELKDTAAFEVDARELATAKVDLNGAKPLKVKDLRWKEKGDEKMLPGTLLIGLGDLLSDGEED